jgi:hypothetical protein
MTRYDFFWPAAELCAWGNARLVGDRTPLPPRLEDGVLHQRFVDIPGQRVAESVEEWYRHLMDRAVVRLRLLPHRWPVSGEILAERPTDHDSVWQYGGHEDGYRTTVWRARLIGEDESVDPSGSPALAEAMRNFAAKLDLTEEARRALGLPSYQRFRGMLAGEVDEQVRFLPPRGYGLQARRLAEAAVKLHSETYGQAALDTTPDTPAFRAHREDLEAVWREALLAAVNSFDPSASEA